MAKHLTQDMPEIGLLDNWWLEDGKIWRTRQQVNAEAIIAQNKAIASDPTNLKASDGMRWALRIPEDHFDVLVRLDPELASVDRQVHHKAWQRFMKSDISRPYRVREPSKRGMTV